MNRKTSGILVTLLLISMLMLAFGIQPIEAEPSTTVDIIHPQQGQFSNYHMRFYAYSSEGWWNTSYNEYVQPHLINTTQTTEQPPYESRTFWCTIDTTNRLVTNTSPDFSPWNQTWYILWIETDVTTESTIDWYDTTALIVGIQTLHVVGCDIDCWVANVTHYDNYALSYYDKISGLMIAYQDFTSGKLQVELTLDTTNIPLGDASIQLMGLIRTIEDWNLHKGTENSLKAKLKVAKHMLDMGKEGGAIRKLTAFINRAEMLRERTLTNEQADCLISEAQRIIDLIKGE